MIRWQQRLDSLNWDSALTSSDHVVGTAKRELCRTMLHAQVACQFEKGLQSPHVPSPHSVVTVGTPTIFDPRADGDPHAYRDVDERNAHRTALRSAAIQSPPFHGSTPTSFATFQIVTNAFSSTGAARALNANVRRTDG